MIDDLYGERLAKDLGLTENPKGTSVPFQWIWACLVHRNEKESPGGTRWRRKRDKSIFTCFTSGPKTNAAFSPLWDGDWPGKRTWAKMPLPPLASYSAYCFFQWPKLGQVSNTKEPQTASLAFCGSLLQQFPAMGLDGSVCVTGARIWPQALWSEAGEWCGLGPWVLSWVLLWSWPQHQRWFDALGLNMFWVTLYCIHM